MSKHVVKESDVDWQVMTRALADRSFEVQFKTLGMHERLAFVILRMKAGVEVPPHSHEAEEVGYVLRGTGETEIGGEKYALGPGDYFSIPSNVSHAIRVIDDMEMIGAMSPPRPEYRPTSA